MLLFAEVGTPHGGILVIEIPDGTVGEEIARLHETEVHGTAAIVVEHDNVRVAVQTLPATGSLVPLTLAVLVEFIEAVRAGDALRRGMLGRGRTLVADVEEVIGVAHPDDVGVDDVELAPGSLSQETRLRGELREISVDVGIVDFVHARALPYGEVYHELPALLVEDRLGSPHAAHLAPFHVLLVGQG